MLDLYYFNSCEYKQKGNNTSNPIYDIKKMGFHKKVIKAQYLKEI